MAGMLQFIRPGQGAAKTTAGTGLTTPPASTDPKTAGGAAGAPAASASLNVGAQGVPGTRSPSGSEASFTTTTITLPKSGRPTTVVTSISTGSALVQVASIGGYFVAGVVQAANPPLVLDVSFLPESTSVAVQSEAAQACVLGFVANFA